jgi:hypothetical protein
MKVGDDCNTVQKTGVATKGIPFRSVFLHAWDLADDGVDNVLGETRDSGLNTLCLAATYHSGWFIHPHNRRHRAFLTEGSVCYFRPQESLYKNAKLRPQLAKLSSDKDWFAEAGKRIDAYGLRLVAWTVGTHNSRLGLLHPELTVRNVYGDSLPHALCPAQEAVAIYLKTLCLDLARNHPLWGIQLEGFCWMAFAHGHHHERDLVGLTPFEQELMGLCVCDACSQRAAGHDVDLAKVKECIKQTLDTAFREAPERPLDHPRSMSELESSCPELRKFNAWRQNYLNLLITEIKAEPLKGTSCRLLMQTQYDRALDGVADGFGCASYEKAPAETLTICRDFKGGMPKNWTGLLQCFVQLGMGIPSSEEEMRAIIAAVYDGGCNGINFYNRSEAPPKMLRWLARTLPDFAK